MATVATIVGLFFLIVIALGFSVRRQQRKTAEDYFLASRSMGSLLLTMGVFATLFSAFGLIGIPGLVYKTGAAFMPNVVFGTAFMTPWIFLLGYKIWLAGKKFGFITPVELFKHRFDNSAVGVIVFVVMVVLVTPYIALQHDAFAHCPGCGHIYWPGTHWDQIRERLESLRTP